MDVASVNGGIRGRGRWSMAILLAVVLWGAATPAHASTPRPRIVTDEYTFGTVIEQRWFAYWRMASTRLRVLDTKTMKKASYRLPQGCYLFDSDSTVGVKAECSGQGDVLVDVRDGHVTRLPRVDLVQDFTWTAVGRYWLWGGSDLYENRATGERVSRPTLKTPRGSAPLHRNLDDPQLRRYTLCAPHQHEIDASGDQQWRDRVIFRDAVHRLRAGRCGSSRTTVLADRKANPDLSLAAGITVWGDSTNCTRHVNAYVARTGRRIRWPLGRVATETCSRDILHTRYAILAALWWGEATDPEDDSPYRTFRMMRLPLPR